MFMGENFNGWWPDPDDVALLSWMFSLESPELCAAGRLGDTAGQLFRFRYR